MKKHLGFTLLEVLTVLAITAALCAILYPVFGRVREKSKETVCVSNLRQIGQAIALYRSSYDGDGKYGSMEEMGLPEDFYVLAKSHNLPRALFVCGPEKGQKSHLYNVRYAPEHSIGVPSWKAYVTAYQESSVLAIDVWHDFPGTPRDSRFVVHHGVGLYLDGHVQEKTKVGDWFSKNEWWSTP